MAKTALIQIRLDPATKLRWETAARELDVSLAEWITTQCDETLRVERFDPPPVSVPTMAKALRAAAKVGPLSKSVLKKLRAQTAETTRTSIVIPQRKGEMVDVHAATPNLVEKCKHGHGFGEVCYKCDRKFGFPYIPDAL